MGLLMLAPCPRTRLPGLAIVNAGALMDRGNVVVEVCFPDVPVMVTLVTPGTAELLETSDKEELVFVGFGEI